MQWNYTQLADAYLKRPDYAETALAAMFAKAGVKPGERACDVGAGVAHLTLRLAAFGLDVTAVEPNDAMRANGIRRCAGLSNVQWYAGTGENTGREADSFDLVTFGSSFNVCDRPAALRETARILRPGGWFVCMWNHRQLEDPLQAAIEAAIAARLPGYSYGTRREDQTEVIDASSLFGPVTTLEGTIVHQQSVADCLEAWRSHATLQRQAGPLWEAVQDDIRKVVAGFGRDPIDVPYTTRIWMAKLAANTKAAH